MSLSKIAEGLTILAKYDPNANVSAEHDELWAGGPAPAEAKPEDLKRLIQLGFSWNETMDSWHRFV